MRTKIVTNNFIGDIDCCLCGEDCQADLVMVVLLAKDSEDPKDRIGAICPKCIKAGPRGAAKRAQQRIAFLREWANELCAQVLGIERITPENWIAIEEMQSAKLQAQEQFKKDNNLPDDWPGKPEVASNMPF